MHFDSETAKLMLVEAEGRLTEARIAVQTYFGNDQLNANSPSQLLAAFAAKEIVLESTDEETLKGLGGYEGATLLLEYKYILNKECKFLASLIEAVQPDGKIYSTYDQTGTISGRYTCKQPNLQQSPRDRDGKPSLRALCTPDLSKGNVFVLGDYSQMELVIAANIAPEPRILQANAAGIDLHKLTGSLIRGIDITEVCPADRQKSKSSNFGLLFAQKADGLQRYAKKAYGVSMTLEEAEYFRDRWFDAYPGFAEWHQRTKEQNKLRVR